MNTNSILKRDDQSDAKFDLILLGRVCIDLNPTPEGYYKSTADVDTFNRYLGGSPANIAVGMARLGKKIGFIAKSLMTNLAHLLLTILKMRALTPRM